MLGLAVLSWVAGFDIIYACQDADFDRATGLHSLPARLGIAGARCWPRASSTRSRSALLAAALRAGPLHPLYLAGMAVVAALPRLRALAGAADDLSRVNAAFFTVNGWISVGYFAFTLAAVLARVNRPRYNPRA